MKTNIFSFRNFGMGIFSMLFVAMCLAPGKTIAQERSAPLSPPKCVQNTMGYLDGHVILWQRMNKQTAAPIIDLCKCATRHISKPKNCIDIAGQVVVNQGFEPENAGEGGTKPSNDGPPNFEILPGKTNCKLISPDEKVIMISGGTIKVGKQCHCVKTPNCNCAGQANCGCDCSCQGAEKWDFKYVDRLDPSKGFYITTRERMPRAIMRNGSGFSLRALNTMDGKMKAMSQWNFFINDRSNAGNTQYQLRPQGSFDKVLAYNSKDGSLIMVNHHVGAAPTPESGSRTANRAVAGAPTSQPFVMMKDWKCECVF